MVVGIGTDIIEIDRVKKACEKSSFIEHVYTKKEIELTINDQGKFATNFAVKEAVSKMLGTGFQKMAPIDIEVLRKESGQPYVILYGEAERRRAELNIDEILVTISDTKDYAVAYVIGQTFD